MNGTLKSFLIVGSLSAGLPLAQSANYYLSASGDDTRSGLSPREAFQSLKRANLLRLLPGDKILLEAGGVFEGGLVLDQDDAGDATHPVEISSYGEGRATIRSANTHGIYVENTGGIRISNLEITGRVCSTSLVDAECPRAFANGIFITNTTWTQRFAGITIADIEAHGFAAIRDYPDAPSASQNDGVGIFVKGQHGTGGFKDVWIENAKTYDNIRAGIIVESAYPLHGHENVHVRNSESYDNSGMPGTNHHMGSGIVLSGIDVGSIEGSFAHNNGRQNQSGGGPVGIWAFNSDRMMIRANRAIENWTLGPSDGGGFDFDGGVSNSVIEYNYSEGNAGPGFLFAQWEGAPPFFNNVIRHNTSVNDARNTNSGGLVVWGNVVSSEIHDNLVVSSRSRSGFGAGAVTVLEWSGTGLSIRNNRLILHNDLSFFNFWLGEWAQLRPQAELRMENNSYMSCEGNFLAQYSDRHHTQTFFRMEDWQAFSPEQMKFEPQGPAPVSEAHIQQYCAGYRAEMPAARPMPIAPLLPLLHYRNRADARYRL